MTGEEMRDGLTRAVEIYECPHGSAYVCRSGNDDHVPTCPPCVADAVIAYLRAAGLLREDDGLRERRESLLVNVAKSAIEAHAHVVMDTPEDQELHDRAITTFRKALDVALQPDAAGTP